jgi:hypothetical protein
LMLLTASASPEREDQVRASIFRNSISDEKFPDKFLSYVLSKIKFRTKITHKINFTLLDTILGLNNTKKY